jgi:type IV secretion system protein TrbC
MRRRRVPVFQPGVIHPMQPSADILDRNWLPCLVLALVIAVSFYPIAAHAATAGGNLPWDTPLTTLRNDITGPVAFTISLLAMVACGAALVFGGEINEFVRRIIMLVLVSAFIVGVTNLASALGITGAIV